MGLVSNISRTENDRTGLHYSKSIKKVGIQVQNGFPLNQFNKIFSSI